MQVAQKRDELQNLLEKIHQERGFDFREYRKTTLTRRLSRRLRARGVETYADYARVLSQGDAEYDKLFDDLTINVTSFFRDELAFKALEKAVLPTMIDENDKAIGARPHIRIWSAGCAHRPGAILYRYTSAGNAGFGDQRSGGHHPSYRHRHQRAGTCS